MKNKTIGWIGTGLMGEAMAYNLIKAGYTLNVYNRTESKTTILVEEGAKYYDSIEKITQDSDVIFTIVGDPASVESVYFGEDGILKNIDEGKIIVDMTTTKPSLAIEIYEKAKQKNVEVLDAPVSGGDIGAKAGTLAIMVGGEEKTFNTILPLFEVMGKNIVLEGKAGSGQHTKAANQIGIAGNTIALCEALLYSEKAGLDLEKVSQIIGSGAAGSWGWTNLAPRIIAGELDTVFFVKHFKKDLKIVLDECEAMNLSLPGLALANELYKQMKAFNGDELGTHALITVLRRMNNMSK
ncbi:NAD(P)-dependent oxidoreductase [Candidatus Gracilibacteria bacterium]|nr:NAD(P)-dependent oxidoreductase [Candidatus Gracilibacteria bacterium]